MTNFATIFVIFSCLCPVPMFQDLSQVLHGSKTWRQICWRGVTKEALSRAQGSETNGNGVAKLGPFENNHPDFHSRIFGEQVFDNFVRLGQPRAN